MITVEVKGDGWTAPLEGLARGFGGPRPLMRAIAGLFEAETEENFSQEGRPKWLVLGLGLAPVTIRRRTRRGTWPGRILQESGQLAASIATDYGADFARVGSNKPYAAIHQAGGMAGRGRKVAIPPRPYLPVDRDGNLQPSAEAGILRLADEYLASLIGPRIAK